MRPSRRRLIPLILGLGAAAFALHVLLRPIPAWALPWMMKTSAALVLPNSTLQEPRPIGWFRKAVGLWLEQSLASHASSAVIIPSHINDAERIAIRLVALKPLFVTQNELWHHSVQAPVGVAGLSWCDGMNGFAAKVLAHDFSRAQIVGVRDAATGASHSFGRVWSAQYDEWLYFDIWPGEIAVFRNSKRRPLQYLFRSRPLKKQGAYEDLEQIRNLYAQAHRGLMHNELQPTLLGYVAARASNLMRHGDTAPAGVSDALAEEFGTAAVATTPPAPPNTTSAPEDYLRARAYHWLGERALARGAYLRFLRAEGDTRSPFGSAARIFVRRLSAEAR